MFLYSGLHRVQGEDFWLGNASALNVPGAGVRPPYGSHGTARDTPMSVPLTTVVTTVTAHYSSHEISLFFVPVGRKALFEVHGALTQASCNLSETTMSTV